METSTIQDSIIKFLKNNILEENVTINAQTILREIGVDSYSIVEIILFIERQFDYVVPDSLLKPENFATIESISNMLNAQLTV